MPIEKPNFFLFTGFGGSGKTTVIDHLHQAGELCVDESHRAVIREQVAAGGSAVPWRDPQAYGVATLNRDIAKFDALAHETRRVFFDRGIPDSFGPDFTPTPDLRRGAESRRYNPHVFVFPPWAEIYRTDAERTEAFSRGAEVHTRLVEAIMARGDTPIDVPLSPVGARVAFILSWVARLGF